MAKRISLTFLFLLCFLFSFSQKKLEMYSNGQLFVDTALSPWMDSINMLLHGRWSPFLDKMKSFARGDWQWTYVHNRNYVSKGNVHTDTLNVGRFIYGRGEPIGDGETQMLFSYYPGGKKLIFDGEIVFLGNSGPLFYKVNKVYGKVAGCFGACLWTLKDTIYKGDKEMFIQSIFDNSKYFVFINNLGPNYSKHHFIGKCVVDEKLEKFKKGFHSTKGQLISCTLLSVVTYAKQETPMRKDSIVDLLFNRKLARTINKGDTILLDIEPHWLYDSVKHEYMQYDIVVQRYPFRVKQMEDLTFFQSYDIAKAEIYPRKPFFYRMFHKKSGWYDESLDPVFGYMREKGMIHKY
jgi:hypothetical protein